MILTPFSKYCLRSLACSAAKSLPEDLLLRNLLKGFFWQLRCHTQKKKIVRKTAISFRFLTQVIPKVAKKALLFLQKCGRAKENV